MNGGSEFDDIKDKGRETITTSSQREGPLEKPISQIVIGATFWINWSLKYKYKYKLRMWWDLANQEHLSWDFYILKLGKKTMIQLKNTLFIATKHNYNL